MLLVFLVCYGLVCIMIFVMNLCSMCSCYVIYWFSDMYFVLIMFNFLINFFVYVFSLVGFSMVMCYFLSFCFCCSSGVVVLYND